VSAQYQICIMRHGVATEQGHGTADDFNRKLTSEGRAEVEKVARGLRQMDVEFDWIVTSPLLRALETAQMVASVYGDRVPFDVTDELRPGKPGDALLNLLCKHPARNTTLLVGHEPDLGIFAARLLHCADLDLNFKKAGCCLIGMDDLSPKTTGQLLWWATPRMLKLIAAQ
jgi:phosphohistidine phosphatase